MKKYLKLLGLLLVLGLFIMGQAGCPGCRDTTKPNVAITSPTNNSTVSGIVTIQATANDNVGVVKVEFYIDGNKVGEDTSSPYEYNWDTDNLQYNSTHTIQAKAYDNAGNVGESPVITVTIGDPNAPEVTITNPHNGDTVSGTVTIQAQVTERSTKTKAPSGISKVEFYIDGSKVGEDTSSPYEYSWNTDTLTFGSTHTIQAKAYDNAGNVGESSVVTVTIGDPNAPQVVITNPTSGATVSGTVIIQAQVTERSKKANKLFSKLLSGIQIFSKAPSGIQKVEFYIDGQKIGEDTSSPYEYSWNTDSLTYGSTHTIQAKAYDNAGNVGESSVITVTIGDTQAPQVTITNPANGSVVSGTVTIQASVVDKVLLTKETIKKAPSGISKVEFYIDDNKVREDTESPYTYDWDTTNLTKNSLHVITAKAYDKAGNIGKDEVTVMIGEVSQVVGVIESPAGITPTDFEVVNIAGTTEVAQDGTFTLTVVQDFQGVVSAVSKTKDFALFSINLKTYAPFASKLIKGLKQKPQKQGVNIGLAINAQSTAEALVFLNPLFATSDPDKQNIIFPIIANDPKVAELANVINQVASSPDPYSEPTFINAYKEAVNSVYNSLPVEYKVSTKSLKSPVDKKVLVLKYPENGGYIELADLDLTKVNFVNNSIKVDFKDAFPGVGVDYIVNIRELFKYQFKTLDDLTAEPHDPWSVFEITSGGTNAVMRLQSDSSTEYADIIGKLASDVLDYFINTTEIQVESNKIYEVSLYSGGFGLGQNNNSTNDKRYIRNSLMAGDKQPLTYVLNALGFNLFIASFDFLRIILPIDEMGGEYFEDSFKSIFMEHIKNQFNWFNTDSDPPKDTEILNWAKNIFADFLSGLADKALTKKAVVRLLKTIAKWLTKAVDIRDKISVIGTLSHRVIDLAHTTPLDRVIVVTGDALPPKAPTNLQIQSVDCNKISLTWQDNSNFEKRYKIERKVEGGNYSQIATVSSNTTSYTDTGLTPGATYYYRIKAYNNAGDSDYSNEASATTLSGQPLFKAPWVGSRKITQGNNAPQYDPYSHYDHGDWDNTWAIDISMPVGTDILAPADGRVVYVDNDPVGGGGKELAIEHTGPTGKKYTTVYLHLSQISVQLNQEVKQGQIIAKSGDTGNVTGPHLHFHLWSGTGRYDLHTMPIERLLLKGPNDDNFREYNAKKGDLDNSKVEGKLFESDNIPVPTTGTIQGNVKDTNNQPIQGATVSVEGTSLQATTNSQGYYQITNVPAGTRTVTASKSGYNSQSKEVNVVAGQTVTVDFQLQSSTSDVVTFADHNLEQAVRDALGIPAGQPITKADMARLTDLDASNRGIQNLSGLEYAINLQNLSLGYNQISDISLLTNLTKLQWLYLMYNQISDISPLANLTNLQYLDLMYNRISNIRPLGSLTNLLWLGLERNQISDISPLASLTNLQGLNLSGNQISNISALANLTKLQSLGLIGNQISDISLLANLTNLQGLGLSGNQISNISALANLTKLQSLALSANQIRDISPLSNLTNLQVLDINDNQISDISPLVSNTGLGQGDVVYLKNNLLDLYSRL
jgi:murein DD-endopeptidase MepM/ murein hydrolase activator NlpD